MKIGQAIRTGASLLVLAAVLICPVCAESGENEILKKGIESAKQGNYDAAVESFTGAMALDPASVDAYYNRGFTYYKQGRLAEAVSDFTAAIKLAPDYADAYYNRALAYYKKNSFDEAIADYNKVIELGPGATDALYGRGLAYYKKNNIKQAMADYNKVIEMRPDFALAYSARAVAYFAKKDYVRTLADVNKAVSLGFRSRPLKDVSPEKIVEVAAVVEKSQPVRLEKDPKRAAAWKAKRRSARIKIYTLTALLAVSLAVILVLLRRMKNARG